MNDWRLLIDPPQSGLENMATDEAILEVCNQGLCPSTVRLYEWSEQTISLGYLQQADNLIKCCSEMNIPHVRRITGGRAVLHADEITYSIICSDSEPLFAEGISGAYKSISRCLLLALQEVGVHAEMQNKRYGMQDTKDISCFHSPSRYEIMVGNKKLVGSAQRRFKKAFLQHGSILFGINKEYMIRLFGEESFGRTAWLGLYSNVKKNEFRAVLIDKIKKGLNINLSVDKINNDEKYLRDKIIKERHQTTDTRPQTPGTSLKSVV